MILAPTLTLHTPAGSRLDPDASAYIAELTSAGVSVTGGQRLALDTFIRAEKAAERWDLHKRLYFPIWGIAAANAICMKSLTSGTFNGTVTHAAGYIQGNGTTGYFDSGAGSEPNTLGLSNASATLFMVVSNNSDASAVQVSSMTSTIAANNRFQLNRFGGQQQFACPTNSNVGPATLVSIADGITNGVFIGSVTATNARYLHRRTTADTLVVSNTATDTTTLSTNQPFVLARNNTGTPDVFCTNARIAVAGWGLAIAQADAAGFSLAIQNLYEATTGLTLP
jgi:hypothetical protein